MLRLLLLLICATFFTGALAQSGSTTVTGPTTTPTAGPPQTTTEGPTSGPTQGPTSEPTQGPTSETTQGPTSETTQGPTSEPTQAPTSGPTQAPQLPANYSYSENNSVCIRLVVNMTLYLEYIDISDQKVTMDPINLADLAFMDESGSSCRHASESNILLGFDILGNEPPAQFLNFSFQRADMVWHNSDLTYSFDVSSLPPNVTSNVTGNVMLTSNGLFSGNVDEKGSYMCKALQNITFNSSSVHYNINATLGVVNLEVQAFMTREEKGQFGSVSYDCANDQGNKIVPIAVGAALAGLVIVVLIAYLIGRLKSRRQNSYEPVP